MYLANTLTISKKYLRKPKQYYTIISKVIYSKLQLAIR